MKYVKILWKNHMPSIDPAIIFSEIDDNFWELRKVEVYDDGTFGYADKFQTKKSMGLGVEPFPSFSEIQAMTDFELMEIPSQEFEIIWKKARES